MWGGGCKNWLHIWGSRLCTSGNHLLPLQTALHVTLTANQKSLSPKCVYLQHPKEKSDLNPEKNLPLFSTYLFWFSSWHLCSKRHLEHASHFAWTLSQHQGTPLWPSSLPRQLQWKQGRIPKTFFCISLWKDIKVSNFQRLKKLLTNRRMAKSAGSRNLLAGWPWASHLIIVRLTLFIC